MLKSIYINNFAIIDEIELDFFTGMSVLTGETGAGKSIIIDALNLALGGRAERSIARKKNNKVEIVATLEISNIDDAANWLKERDLYTGNDCILRRVISADGKSKAYINNSPCSVSGLRIFGDLLVDIYGQHEHQSLMHKDKQRELLDCYAGNEEKLEKLAALYRLWQSLNNQLQIIENSHEKNLSQLELLRYQDQELEQLNLINGEYEELNENYSRLSNAKDLTTNSMFVSKKLAGDSENTIYDQLNNLIKKLEKFFAIDEALKTPIDGLNDIQILVKDVSDVLRNYSESISTNPEELHLLEERISAIEEIARKHKVKPEQLIALRKSVQASLAKFESSHEDPEKIKISMNKTEKHYHALAHEISSSRERAASKLNEKISISMQSLGMKGGKFHIDIQTKDTTELSLHGIDEIQFLVCTNPGQVMRPVNKVASGGELSRLSLAIQMATANNLGIPTLIFDEVDSGVGGATAEVVGRHLRKLSNDAQVFCVTHLPQVAAQAHHHYSVTKRQQDKSTVTNITHLTESARVDELARMLGGIEMTQSTHDHAKDMLSQIKS